MSFFPVFTEGSDPFGHSDQDLFSRIIPILKPFFKTKRESNSFGSFNFGTGLLGEFFNQGFYKKVFFSIWKKDIYIRKMRKYLISVLLYRIPFIEHLVCKVLYKDYILYLIFTTVL